MSHNPSKVNSSPTETAEPKGDSEALLVGDGIPRWLSSRLSSIQESSTYLGDVFVSTLDVLMHESGFSSDVVNSSMSFDIGIMRSLSNKRVHFDAQNSNYQIEYSYSNVKIILIVVPFGDAVVVNLFLPDIKTVSLTFNMTEFVDFKHPRVKNGHKLAVIFKNALCEIKSLFRLETLNPAHILSLPVEILISIGQYLTPESFFYFASTCHQLYYTLYEEEAIWKHIARLFLPSRNSQSERWKDFVIYQHKSKLRERKLMNVESICLWENGGYPRFADVFHHNMFSYT